MDYVTLPSGRKVSANDGIIGISPTLGISEGYDGRIPHKTGETYADENCLREDALTFAECVELADIAILSWQAFRAKMQTLAAKTFASEPSSA